MAQSPGSRLFSFFLYYKKYNFFLIFFPTAQFCRNSTKLRTFKGGPGKTRPKPAMQHHVSAQDRIRSNILERKPAPNAGARREQLITTADHRWQRCKLHHGTAWFFSFSYLRLTATDLFSDSAAARHRNGGMMPYPLHAHV
jgi:hypothetical protein